MRTFKLLLRQYAIKHWVSLVGVILEFNEGKFGPERNRAYIKIIPTVCFEALESRNFDS